MPSDIKKCNEVIDSTEVKLNKYKLLGRTFNQICNKELIKKYNAYYNTTIEKLHNDLGLLEDLLDKQLKEDLVNKDHQTIQKIKSQTKNQFLILLIPKMIFILCIISLIYLI